MNHLLANLQHHSHNNSLSSGNQVLVKKHKENIGLLSPEVDDSEAVARRGSMKNGVLKNFTKFTGKHLCQSLFFNKV